MSQLPLRKRQQNRTDLKWLPVFGHSATKPEFAIPSPVILPEPERVSRQPRSHGRHH